MMPGEATKLVVFMRAAFPRVEIPEETARLYAVSLLDVDREAATRAVSKLVVNSGRFFPTIAELREQIADAAGAGVPDADRAWGEVMRAVSKFGAYRSPVFSHPAIAATVESLTWREICASDNVPALRAHFGKAYEAAKKRAIDPAHVALVDNLSRHLLRQLDAGERMLATPKRPELTEGKP